MSDYWQPTGTDWSQTMTPAVDYSNIPSVNLGGINALSAATQPTQSSSFDWINGIKAIGGLAQDIGRGIYLAKGYQPGPFMGSGGFSGEMDRQTQESDIEDFIAELLNKAKEKRDQGFELTPLTGSKTVV
jgi:hypothetical protein